MSKKLDAFAELQTRIQQEQNELKEFKKIAENLTEEKDNHVYVIKLTRNVLLAAVEREALERQYQIAQLEDQLVGMLK